MSWGGWILLGVALGLIAHFFRLLFRQDERRRERPMPDRERGGGSFGNTSYWGGHGRPGS